MKSFVNVNNLRSKSVTKLVRSMRVFLLVGLMITQGTLVPSVGIARGATNDPIVDLPTKLQEHFESLCNNGTKDLGLPFLEMNFSTCYEILRKKFSDTEWEQLEMYSEKYVSENMDSRQIEDLKMFFATSKRDLKLPAAIEFTTNLTEVATIQGVAIFAFYCIVVFGGIYLSGNDNRAKERVNTFERSLSECENVRNAEISADSPNRAILRSVNTKLCLDQLEAILGQP